MKGKVFVDHNHIINWIPENPTGDVDGIMLACEVMTELLNEHNSTSILVDLSKAQRPNAEQRQVIIDAISNNRKKIQKIALYGESPLMKAVASFVINTAGFENMRFFSSRSQAEGWLLGREIHETPDEH